MLNTSEDLRFDYIVAELGDDETRSVAKSFVDVDIAQQHDDRVLLEVQFVRR